MTKNIFLRKRNKFSCPLSLNCITKPKCQQQKNFVFSFSFWFQFIQQIDHKSSFYSRLELTMVKRHGIGLAGSPAGRGTFCGIPQIKRTSLSTIVSSCPYELMKFRTMLGITILLRYFVILYLVSVYILGYLKAPKF